MSFLKKPFIESPPLYVLELKPMILFNKQLVHDF